VPGLVGFRVHRGVFGHAVLLASMWVQRSQAKKVSRPLVRAFMRWPKIRQSQFIRAS
jgi:hypothetical protein